jgi:plastocyanin
MTRDRPHVGSRRGVLRATGTAVTAVLTAGCTAENDDESGAAPATESDSKTTAGGETTTDRPTTSSHPPTTSGTTTVTIQDESFSPRRLRVSTGTEVTWRNDGSGFHAVQSDVLTDAGTEWSFYSADMPTGRSVTHTFPEPGVHEYYCTSHGAEAMCGVVLVGDVEYDSQLPCEQN